MNIGIGGVSNSGKSMLAIEIANRISDFSVKILCQDDFVKPVENIPKVKGHVDWETPESINFQAFNKAIVSNAESNDVVIAEGLMIFYDPVTFSMFDKKIFIELNREVFLRRKSVDLRWGKEPDWYMNHIWESYIKYGRPPASPDVITLDGSKKFDIDSILGQLGF